jgi:outer membrane protein
MHVFRLRPRAAFALAIASVVGALIARPAHGQSQSLSAGYTRETVHSESPDLTGPLTPAGANLRVAGANTLFISYTHDLPANFQFEFAAGIPPQHRAEGEGLLASGGTISSFRQAAPTTFINYVFAGPDARFVPSAGVGFNYTHFYDGKSTVSGDEVAGGPTSLKLSDSWGLSGHVNLKWRIDPQWFLIGGVTKSHVSSTLTADTSGLMRTTNINFRPVIFTFGAGYAF